MTDRNASSAQNEAGATSARVIASAKAFMSAPGIVNGQLRWLTAALHGHASCNPLSRPFSREA
jgi:hypothetical protein